VRVLALLCDHAHRGRQQSVVAANAFIELLAVMVL
jgi:hypothetical protein